MNAVRLIILLVAAVAAIGLAFVVRGAFGDKKAPAATAAPTVAAVSKPQVQVLVAKRDLPVGTRLTPADVVWQSWPAEGLNPAFITDGAPPAAPETGAKGAVDGAKKAASTAKHKAKVATHKAKVAADKADDAAKAAASK